MQSQINELKQLITNAQNAIDTHAARRDNPHVVTRAQLSLATTDSVVFNKVSAPSGFFKEWWDKQDITNSPEWNTPEQEII